MAAWESGGDGCDYASLVDGFVAHWGRIALAVVAAAVVAKIVIGLTVRSKKLPPGPAPWPVLGNIASLAGLPHRSLEKLARKYGGLMYLRLGSKPCVVVSTAEVARELFKTNDIIVSNRPGGCFFENLAEYRNITSSPYGAHWRQLRKICASELFTQKRLDSYKDSRLEEIRTAVKELFEQSENRGPVNIHDWLHRLLSNNLTRVIMNERYFGTDEKGMQGAKEFERVTALMFSQAGDVVLSDFIPYMAFLTKLQGKPKLYRKTRDIVLEMMRKMVNFDERKKLHDEGGSTGKPEDFVDVLLSSTLADGETRLPDDICLLLLMDMLVAGTDTSSTTIEWTIAELLRHPDKLKRVREELNSVVGANQLVKEEDLDRLPYLNAIVKESFRLHPATPLGLPRESHQPFQLQGYTLPKGTRLFINQWAVHRDPGVYDLPEEFKPERFLEGGEISIVGDSQYQLIPFGSGRRNCVGLPMAQLVIRLVLAHLLHSVDFALPEGQEPKDLDMSESFGIAAPLVSPLMLYATPRESAALY
jgi:cytochrome P450